MDQRDERLLQPRRSLEEFQKDSTASINITFDELPSTFNKVEVEAICPWGFGVVTRRYCFINFSLVEWRDEELTLRLREFFEVQIREDGLP